MKQQLVIVILATILVLSLIANVILSFRTTKITPPVLYDTNTTVTNSPTVTDVIVPTDYVPIPTGTPQALSEGENEKTVNGKTYAFMYTTVGYEFAPDTRTFAGFRVCDDKASTCTVFGIPYAYLAKYFEGERYTIYFDAIGECGAAAGTTYCPVVGDITEVVVLPTR